MVRSPSCHTTNQRIPPCATDTKSVLPAGSHWQDLVGERECFAGILVETVDVVRPFPDLLSFEIKHSGNGRISIEGHPGSVNKGEVVIHLHWQTIMRNREHQDLSAQRGRSHAISRNHRGRVRRCRRPGVWTIFVAGYPAEVEVKN